MLEAQTAANLKATLTAQFHLYVHPLLLCVIRRLIGPLHVGLRGMVRLGRMQVRFNVIKD